MTAPLTGTDLEIARRLNAGQHPAFIAHVGWYRAAWSPEDVRWVIGYLWALAMQSEAERQSIEAATRHEPRRKTA